MTPIGTLVVALLQVAPLVIAGGLAILVLWLVDVAGRAEA